MFCKNCGRQLLPDEKFCADCGTPVPSQESEVQNEQMNTQNVADNQPIEQPTEKNVPNEQTQPVENQQTDAYNNQTPVNDYAAPQYQTVDAQGGYNQYQNGQQSGYAYDYNNQIQPQYAQPVPKKKSKTPFVITACGIAVALVIAIAAFFVFNSLNKVTPQGQIQGTWVAEENGISLQLEFKPDGTIGIPNAKELGQLISGYAGASDYSSFINYDEIFNMIKLTYSIDDEKTLKVDINIPILQTGGSQSQSLKWSDDPANGGSGTWGIEGDTLYIAGTKLTRINN